MNISINAPAEAKRHDFQNSVIERVTKTLHRFSNRISHVTVTLIDENGPRGGVDQLCKIRVVTPHFGEITTSAKCEDPWAAITESIERAQRNLLTKLKRRQSIRWRNHNKTTDPIEVPLDDNLKE